MSEPELLDEPATIKVLYFRPSGKFYAEGSYQTRMWNMFNVFDEFRDMLKRGERPGLCSGNSGFTAVLICDGHPNGYPAAFIGEA